MHSVKPTGYHTIGGKEKYYVEWGHIWFNPFRKWSYFGNPILNFFRWNSHGSKNIRYLGVSKNNNISYVMDTEGVLVYWLCFWILRTIKYYYINIKRYSPLYSSFLDYFHPHFECCCPLWYPPHEIKYENWSISKNNYRKYEMTSLNYWGSIREAPAWLCPTSSWALLYLHDTENIPSTLSKWCWHHL